jgi:hypothetical protein
LANLRDPVCTLIESMMYFRRKWSQGRFYLQILEAIAPVIRSASE